MIRLSPNAINKYSECGHAYKLRYIDQDKRSFMSFTMFCGRVAEKTIEMYFNTHQGPVWNLFQQALIDEFNALDDTPEGFTEALVAWLMEDSDANFEALNTIARGFNKCGMAYNPGVKNNNSRSSKKLFANKLLKVFDDVEGALKQEAFKQLFNEIADFKFQVPLEYTVPHSKDVLFGYADLVIEKNDGSILCLDIKYSDHDYSEYNYNKDTQLLTYALALQKMYPDRHVDVGFMTPCQTPLFHMCDMTQLVSRVSVSRILMSVKGIKADLFIPSCGGGAYKDLSKLCEYKNTCEFGSCRSVKQEDGEGVE